MRLQNCIVQKKRNGNYLVFNPFVHNPIELDKYGLNYLKSLMGNIVPHGINPELNRNEKEYIELFNELSIKNCLSRPGTKNVNAVSRSSIHFSKKHYVLQLTNQCNLSCTYCKLIPEQKDREHLPNISWEKVLSRILPDAKRITLTGGEALLHPQIKDIIFQIREYNADISIVLISNACIDFEKLNISNVFSMINEIRIHCDNIDNDDHKRVGFDKHVFLTNIDYLKKQGFTDKILITSMWIKGKTELLNSIKRYSIHKGIRHKTTVKPSCFFYTDKLTSLVIVSADEVNNKFDPSNVKIPRVINPSISA